MKRSKAIYFVSALMILTSMMSSCGVISNQFNDEKKIIVEEFGYVNPSMSSQIADVNNLEAVTELASHIIKCKVKSLDDITYNDINLFNFKYSVEVIDIMLDVNDTLKSGDIISVTSSEGIMKASDAAAMIKDTPRAKKLGILQDEYQDNEYITSSTWDAIPIEVGKTYIMFITDRYLADEGVYAESGRRFLYEVEEQTAFSGRAMTADAKSTNDILNDIASQIELRTGRVDEVGAEQYIRELGERQAQMIDIDTEDIIE